MSTTPRTPTPTGVGAEIKNFFSRLGKEIENLGTNLQKAISAADKEIPAIEPVLNDTLSQIFPGAAIPVEVVEKVIKVALNAGSAVATAMQSAGLNPTTDQVAAVAVAGLIHSLKVTPAKAAAATMAPSTPTS